MLGKVFHILPAEILDIVMPRRCIACGRNLLVHEEHLCTWCRADLPLTFFWLQGRNAMADRFNLMLQREIDRKVQEGEDVNPPGYAYAAALFFYRSGTGYEKITQSLKYHADIPAGRFFARLLAERLRDCSFLGDVDAVVPVPLHWTRRWKRGYNQAEVIASQLVESGIGGTMIPNLLIRNRRTRTQTKISVRQKAGNVRGAFSVDPGTGRRYRGKLRSILLVDDVFTTGATLHECWKTLMEWDPDLHISIATLGYVG